MLIIETNTRIFELYEFEFMEDNIHPCPIVMPNHILNQRHRLFGTREDFMPEDA
jgi:hypothetical protein